MENIIKYEDFTKVDIRLGTIVDAEEYAEIKNPSIINLIKIGKSSNASAVLLFRKVTAPKRHGVPTLKKISNHLQM